jgi:hypothetical protein
MGNNFGNGSTLQVTAARFCGTGWRPTREEVAQQQHSKSIPIWQGSGGMTLGQAVSGGGQKIPKKVLNRLAPSRHQSMEGGGLVASAAKRGR